MRASVGLQGLARFQQASTIDLCILRLHCIVLGVADQTIFLLKPFFILKIDTTSRSLLEVRNLIFSFLSGRYSLSVTAAPGKLNSTHEATISFLVDFRGCLLYQHRTLRAWPRIAAAISRFSDELASLLLAVHDDYSQKTLQWKLLQYQLIAELWNYPLILSLRMSG